ERKRRARAATACPGHGRTLSSSPSVQPANTARATRGRFGQSRQAAGTPRPLAPQHLRRKASPTVNDSPLNAGTFTFLKALAMHFAAGVPTHGPLSTTAFCAVPAGENVIMTCPSPFATFVALHFERSTSVIAVMAADLSNSAVTSSVFGGSEAFF